MKKKYQQPESSSSDESEEISVGRIGSSEESGENSADDVESYPGDYGSDDEIDVGAIDSDEEQEIEGNYGDSDDDDLDGDEDGLDYDERNEWEVTDRQERKVKDIDRNQRSSYASEEEFIKEMNRRGIVYVSRIPFGMQPFHLRHLFQQHAKHPILRVHCDLESPEETARRKARGGNAKKQYKEGWVEFESKKDAIYVVQICNGKPCSYNRNNRFHNQMWTMKYLKHYKWYHLTEELRMKNRVREKKLRTRVDQARREANEYLENAEKSRYKGKKKKGNRTNEASAKKEEPSKKRKKTETEDDDFENTNQSSTTGKSNKKQKQSKMNDMFEEKDVLLDDGFLKQILGDRSEGDDAKKKRKKEKKGKQKSASG